MLLEDSSTKCLQFIAGSQTTGQDWPRTNRRRLKTSGAEVLEHVPGSGLKHDKTSSFETQELHTAQKWKSGLLTGKTVQQSLHGREEEKAKSSGGFGAMLALGGQGDTSLRSQGSGWFVPS